MEVGESYYAKSKHRVGVLEILAKFKDVVKIRWQQPGEEEWVYKTVFKSYHSYVDPEIKLIEKIAIDNFSENIITDKNSLVSEN